MRHEGANHFVGLYDTEIDAALAADHALMYYKGVLCLPHVNFPDVATVPRIVVERRPNDGSGSGAESIPIALSSETFRGVLEWASAGLPCYGCVPRDI